MIQQAWAKEIEEIQKLISEFIIENQNLCKEIESVIGAQDDVVTLLYSRRALEVIITELCADKLCRERGTEPLNSLIDKLYREKFLPEYIQTSMQNLNRISTFGAHPKEFDPRQVRTTLIELVTVLEWFFKERNYKTAEKKSVIPEKQIKAEPQVSSSIKVDKPLSTGTTTTIKEKKKRPIVAISIVLVSIAALVILIFIFKQKSTNISFPIKADTVVIGSTDKQKTPIKHAARDTQAALKTTEVIINTTVAPSEKKPTTAINPTIKSEKPVVKENKKTYTMQAPAQPAQSADIHKLFQQLSNPDKPFSERKNALLKLQMEFAKEAIITIFIDNKAMEKIAANDYLNRLLLLKGFEVKILYQEKNTDGKIKAMNVAQIRK